MQFFNWMHASNEYISIFSIDVLQMFQYVDDAYLW